VSRFAPSNRLFQEKFYPITRSDDEAKALILTAAMAGVIALGCAAARGADDSAPARGTPSEKTSTVKIRIKVEEWNRIIRINLSGVFLCMKYEIPLMLKQGGGAIVNTASGAGVKGFAGQAAYAAAKHVVIGLTKSAALDYAAQNIRVNAVCPGIIATPMMDRFTGGTHEGEQRVIAQEPIARMGKPEEIAATVVWLCSNAAAFVIGHAMVIDGGQTM
jgi:NAD(P)-dependent dehydrogenase (short-subunit alcohol dehydrogenase family)